ncbi:TldD/PmbA family protein [Candidatus Woesearchaeota archaeon]|nr:TldD/PmbA family protein [Candidatus Woesearchaeota archaeon]
MAVDFDSAEFALESALKQGAKFADIRLERSVYNGFLLKNGIPEVSAFDDSTGMGIRVFINRTVGFSATNNLSRDGIRNAVNWAIKDAKSCSRLKNSISLTKAKPHIDKYKVVQKTNLEDISPREKLNELFEIDKAILSTNAKAPARYFSLSDTINEKYYVNSEGSRIFSEVPRVNFYYFITLIEGRKSSQRYWQYGKAAGFEAVREFDLPNTLSADIVNLRKNMKKGVSPPKGKIDAVVGPQITGIIVHESGGHPYEADRILGREAAQAGESFITEESTGLQIGSNAVSITDDPTIPNSFGFYLYDDEGAKAETKQLMNEGRISGFLHSRETSAAMKMPINASARANSYDREAIPRMSNTAIAPGDFTEEELIEDVRKGVYIKNFTEWNIDDKRVNQKYVGAEAYAIRNGRLEEPVLSPTIEITTHALYKAIDAVANNMEYHAGTCGKGEPMQALPVWFGGPSIRIKGIKLK